MADGRPKHLAAADPPRRWPVLLLAVLASVAAVGAASVVDRSGPVVAQSASTTSPPAPPTSPREPGPPTTAAGARERGPLGSGEPVTLAFAGDMSFEGANRLRLDADPASVLSAIAPTISAADVAVGNLETALGEAGSPWPGKEYTFRAPASALDALRAAGFDVVSMANNHGMDYGTDGLEASVAISRGQPDRFVIGIGADEATLAEAGADVIVGGHAHRAQGAGRLGGALVGYGR